MKTFLQYYDAMFPPPVEYDLKPYQITANLDDINSEKSSGYELKPIPDLGIASVSAVGDWMSKHGRNLTKLGKPMTDDEFNAFYGLSTEKRRGR